MTQSNTRRRNSWILYQWKREVPKLSKKLWCMKTIKIKLWIQLILVFAKSILILLISWIKRPRMSYMGPLLFRKSSKRGRTSPMTIWSHHRQQQTFRNFRSRMERKLTFWRSNNNHAMLNELVGYRTWKWQNLLKQEC